MTTTRASRSSLFQEHSFLRTQLHLLKRLSHVRWIAAQIAPWKRPNHFELFHGKTLRSRELKQLDQRSRRSKSEWRKGEEMAGEEEGERGGRERTGRRVFDDRDIRGRWVKMERERTNGSRRERECKIVTRQ